MKRPPSRRRFESISATSQPERLQRCYLYAPQGHKRAVPSAYTDRSDATALDDHVGSDNPRFCAADWTPARYLRNPIWTREDQPPFHDRGGEITCYKIFPSVVRTQRWTSILGPPATASGITWDHYWKVYLRSGNRGQPVPLSLRPPACHRLPLLRLEYPSSRFLALLLEELRMAVMMLSSACEGSIHAEGDHTLPSLLDPAVGWVRNIPIPTLVAYREKVFPREIHHLLSLERPECWVTGDSIGLFLETECQFPLESEDECYYDDEEHEFLPRYRRQGCGLTKSFVKKASLELIGLYRRFLLPDLAGPKLKLVCSPENRDRWIVPLHFDAFSERLYHD